MKEYLSKQVNPTLVKGLTELCKQKPKDPIVSIMLVYVHYCEYNYNASIV